MRCPLVTGVQTCALPISQKFAHAIRLCSRRDIELTNWKPRFKRWILFVDPFRQNGQTLFVHFREAAFDHDCFRLAICAGENLKCSVADGGHEGGMPLQHAEIALAAGDDDHMDIFRADELCWGYEFEMQCNVCFLGPSPSGELGWEAISGDR